jgi:hypothetical protein
VDTVFLLGSGISIDAGMPAVGAITEQVVSGDGAFLHSANVFLIGAESPNYALHRPPVEPVLAVVNDLRERARDYFGREPNYEEISQLGRQLDDALSGEYESAAVMPLAAELRQRDYAGGDYARLRDLTALVHRYIEDTVRTMLAKPAQRTDHLRAITDACRELGAVTLASLNHDLVLEAALETSGISYGDGFDSTGEDVRLWVDEWPETGPRLLKLHGSLDWWGYRLTADAWRGWVTGRYRGPDALHPSRAGVEPYPHDLRPLILTGTFDKILAYETWVFPDQHLRFHEALRRSNRVIVIGYGFGDKAVNTRLISWLARARENTMIVAHGDPDDLRARARGAIQGKWNEWQRNGQLVLVAAWVDDLDWDTIATRLS